MKIKFKSLNDLELEFGDEWRNKVFDIHNTGKIYRWPESWDVHLNNTYEVDENIYNSIKENKIYRITTTDNKRFPVYGSIPFSVFTSVYTSNELLLEPNIDKIKNHLKKLNI